MPHPVPPVASPLSSSSRAGVKPRRGWSSEDEHHRLSWELSYLQMPSPPVLLQLRLHLGEHLPAPRDCVLTELHRVGV